MPRDFQINGETLVRVRFGGHLAGGVGGGVIDGALFPGTAPVAGGSGQLYELGLAVEDVTVMPQFSHKDVKCDDFGPDIPAEIIAMLAAVYVRMRLVHYDVNVLEAAQGEAFGGNAAPTVGAGATSMVMPGAGALLGHGLPIGMSGNHFVSLNLLSPQLLYPWQFPAAYLAGQPVEYPLGTEASMVSCVWRCVPYSYPGEGAGTALTASGSSASGNPFGKEVSSSGRTLWNRTLDPP